MYVTIDETFKHWHVKKNEINKLKNVLEHILWWFLIDGSLPAMFLPFFFYYGYDETLWLLFLLSYGPVFVASVMDATFSWLIK